MLDFLCVGFAVGELALLNKNRYYSSYSMRIDKTNRWFNPQKPEEMKRTLFIGFLAIVVLISGCVKPETQPIKFPDNLTEHHRLARSRTK
jgi:hypothetical protein